MRMNDKTMNNEQWLAIKNCDKSYDGKFFYALKSTKTVCKPSCNARTPNPKNIEIFYSVEDAEKCGYRPCQRCRSDQMEWQGSKIELATKAKNYIDKQYADKLSSKSIGNNLYIDPYYLHRAFREVMGTTLLGYQHQVRIDRARKLLSDTDLAVSFISNEVGYSSLSHFSRTFKKLLGVSPSQYRDELHKKNTTSS